MPTFIGNAELPHDYSYVPDIAAGLYAGQGSSRRRSGVHLTGPEGAAIPKDPQLHRADGTKGYRYDQRGRFCVSWGGPRHPLPQPA